MKLCPRAQWFVFFTRILVSIELLVSCCYGHGSTLMFCSNLSDLFMLICVEYKHEA